MKFLDKFNQAFGFTKTESRVVLFLVVTFLIGLGIKAFWSGSTKPRFDYSASDSEFAARSRSLDGIPAETMKTETAQQASPGMPMASSATPSMHLIDLNTATKDELVALPGIGEAMAERIMLYRDENGPFHSIDELSHIKGIGKKKFERIAPLCTVGK